MKKILTVLLFLPIIYSSCKKESKVIHPVHVSASFVDSTVSFLKTTLVTSDFNKLDLKRYQILQFKNKKIGIQLFEKGSSTKFLLLQYKNNLYSGNWVDITLLYKVKPRFRSGTINLRNALNNSIIILTIDNNQVIGADSSSGATISTFKDNLNQRIGSTERNANAEVAIPLPPYEVLPTVFIYLDDSGDGDSFYTSMYWMLGGSNDFTNYYYNEDPSMISNYYGSGVGSGTPPINENNVVEAPLFTPPDEPIINIGQELKCFTINATSTYNVIVNVNQPYPGSRDALNINADFKVGHTFLTLEQFNADGTSIIRNIGYYPKHGSKPGATYDQGIFGDDSNTPFDVSLNFSINGNDMHTVINSLFNQQDYGYDMNTFNCTNSAMNALSSIGVVLPSTKETGPIFSGNDPAELGEDIRALDLNSFSAENGGKKIVRTVSNTNNFKAPPRKGTC